MQRLRLLGLSLTALLALAAVFSGPALATGAPENITPPKIVTKTIVVGGSVLAEKGTWTNSPTSYVFQWRRCNVAGAECVDISGATGQVYKATELDRDKTLVLKVTAKNASGEASASSAPSAVVTSPYPEIIPRPTEKEPVLFSSSGSMLFTGKEIGGFECHVSLEGRFVNSHEAKQVKFTYSNCSSGLPTPAGEMLEGSLGWVNKATKTVALRIKPESTTNNIWATNFRLPGKPETLNGTNFGEFGPVGTLTNHFSLTYKEEAGRQAIRSFEGAGENNQLYWGPHGTESWVNLNTSLAVNLAKTVEIK